MAAERPFVSTFHGGIPELVAGVDAGVLAPEADPRALRQALQRHGEFRRHHHFQRGRRQVEDGSVDIEQHGARWQCRSVDEQIALPNC